MIRTASIFAMVLLASHSGTCIAFDRDEHVRETQIVRSGKGTLNLTWWITTEFWDASFRSEASMSSEQIDAFIDVVDDYIVLAIVDAKLGPMASVQAVSKQDLEAKTTVTFKGRTLKPVADADISPDARNFFEMMKPLLANMLGQLGQGLQFILFEGQDENGTALIDPKSEGFLLVEVGDQDFRWRLPLGSLLPSMYDSATAERFPGNYKFNPYTGKALSAQTK